jgi:spore coat polysaccharide biosynthesis protein SpsF (cytidylyltransferase family)
MKVKQETTAFHPVVLTMETKADFELVRNAIGYMLDDEEDKETHASLNSLFDKLQEIVK